MKQLHKAIFDLICKTSTELPADVTNAIKNSYKNEKKNSSARYTLDIILENIKLAKKKRQPICQDTGTINFYIRAPNTIDQKKIEDAIKWAILKATKEGFLRPNSVEPIKNKNAGITFPNIHFELHNGNKLEIGLLLKGGGSENMSRQYALPSDTLDADRNLEGVKKCVLDTITKAKGKGCAPGIIGVCIGGDRATGYAHAKKQLLRKLTDRNKNKTLARLEEDIMKSANSLGIGPMGLGGRTTLLGCKIGTLERHPASYFVSVAYMCWACRKQKTVLRTAYGVRRK